MKRQKRKATTAVVTSLTKSRYFQNQKLGREFFDQPSIELSKALLGKVLVRKLPNGEIIRGTIVETEAYPGENDQASHSYHRKKTERNAAMFMDPGTLYVYFTYGMYHCVNISSQGEGAACLLRGIEPLENYDIMHQFRNQSRKKNKTNGTEKPATKVEKKKNPLKHHELANGPGKLCLAFDINRATCDKQDLCTSDLMWLEHHEDAKFHEGNFAVEEAKRVGIDSVPAEARNQLWRFYIVDNFAVSTAKPSQIKKKLQSQQAQE